MAAEFHMTVKKSRTDTDKVHYLFQLWHVHLLQLKSHPNNKRVFCLNDLVVTHCQTQGVICEKRSIGKTWMIYLVDDGTAVIPVLFAQDNEKLKYYIRGEAEHLTSKYDSSREMQYSPRQAKLLTKMLSKVKSSSMDSMTEFEVGETIQVEGRISLFKDNIQIIANQASRILDLNEEVNRIKRVLEVYHKYIDKHL